MSSLGHFLDDFSIKLIATISVSENYYVGNIRQLCMFATIINTINNFELYYPILAMFMTKTLPVCYYHIQQKPYEVHSHSLF